MTDGIYASLAPVYDALNGDVDYVKWADFVEKNLRDNFNGRVEYILDLGCGTGSMTLELAKRGYDMIGVDISPEMLNVAENRAEKDGVDGILWLCQDMTEFELYGTVEATVCCLDGINHLLDRTEVEACFSLVKNYSVPDGIFIFDINSQYKFENIYGQNDYIIEEENTLCAWQNDYSDEDKLCDFRLSIFEKNKKDDTYTRYDCEQCERMYTRSEIELMLENTGFELISVYSDTDFGRVEDNSERLHFVARAKKQ